MAFIDDNALSQLIRKIKEKFTSVERDVDKRFTDLDFDFDSKVDKSTFQQTVNQINKNIENSQSKLTASHGIKIDGTTIKHTNSVVANRVGSGVKIPIIQYDAQGHITNTNEVTVYPPTSSGANGQYWVSDGEGEGYWQTLVDNIDLSNDIIGEELGQAVKASAVKQMYIALKNFIIEEFDVTNNPLVTIVNELPTENISKNTLYLIVREDGEQEELNIYDEYAYITVDGHSFWEKIGSTKIDLGDYVKSEYFVQQMALKADANNVYTKSEVNTELNKKYTKPSDGIPKSHLSTEVQNLLDKANSAIQDHQDISGKEDKSNKVVGWGSTTSDDKYPSEKLVKTSLDNKNSKLTYNDYSSTEITDDTPITNFSSAETDNPTRYFRRTWLQAWNYIFGKAKSEFVGKRLYTSNSTQYQKITYSTNVAHQDLLISGRDRSGGNYIYLLSIGGADMASYSDRSVICTALNVPKGRMGNGRLVGIKYDKSGNIYLKQSNNLPRLTVYPLTVDSSTCTCVTSTENEYEQEGLLVCEIADAYTTLNPPSIPTKVSDLSDASDFVKTNDSRLSDSRDPKAHTHTKSEITDFPTLGTASAKNVASSLTESTTTEDLPTSKLVASLVKGKKSISSVARTTTGSQGGNDVITVTYTDNTKDTFNVYHPKDGVTQDVSGKEDKSNKIVDWSSTASNSKYPSEKLVKDTFMTKNNPSGSGSFSMNRKADTTVGVNSHAEGYSTASGDYSHAEGYETNASGNFSHTEGYSTTASGRLSHAEGYETNASGNFSHTEGYETNASGNYSHTEGRGTRASGEYSHVQGKYNVEDTASKFADIVGAGTSDTNRKNIEATDWNGNKYLKGDVYVHAEDDSSGGDKLATEEFVNTSVGGITVPTKTSQLENDSDFATKSDVDSKNDKITIEDKTSEDVSTSDFTILSDVNSNTNPTSIYKRKVSQVWSYIKKNLTTKLISYLVGSEADSSITDMSTTSSYDSRLIALKNETVSESNGGLRWLSLSILWTYIRNKIRDNNLLLKNSIQFVGTKATHTMIKFLDNTTDTNGDGIVIGGGGATVIGGGESANTWSSDTSKVASASSEIMDVVNDGVVRIVTNLQSGVANAKISTFDRNGNLTIQGDIYVGDDKKVLSVASQALTDTEKSQVRTNIGAGTSSFSGSYNDLSDKPTIPTVTDTYSSTSSNAMSGKAVASAINNKVDKVSGKGLSTNDFTDTLKTKLNGIAEGANSRVFQGTCSTAAATATKEIDIGDSEYQAQIGDILVVKFTYSNTASNVNFTVGKTTKKGVYYNNDVYTSTSSTVLGYANRHTTYMWNGTYWVWLSNGVDNNTTYTPQSLGFGYEDLELGSPTEETIARTARISGYGLTTNGIISVRFKSDVPANATLNISYATSDTATQTYRGAKAIYYQNKALTDNVIKNGDLVTFIYSGSYYHIISIDRFVGFRVRVGRPDTITVGDIWIE